MWADANGGYAILALLVLGLLGAMLAPGGLRNRRRAPQRIFAAALLAGAAMTLLWPARQARMLRQGATTARATPVTGLWVYGADTLLLATDGSYSCRGGSCTGLAQRGTWRLGADGRMIVRWYDGHEVWWRVVRYNGRDRLGLSAAPGAGATWDAGLSFMHVAP
ncbi:hypothetical protein BH09GEM1_BH09GEM1_38540 [soil metagenome]